MKISVIAMPEVALGKHNIKDPRLDEVDKIVKAKKKTYIQVEVVGEDSAIDADAILLPKDSCMDLILKDMEFVETRLSRTESQADKDILNKIKAVLDKEQFVRSAALNEEEKKAIVVYNLLTNKPVVAASADDLADINALLARAVKEAGYISFFTAGEKDTRAWLIKNGETAWEASGAIHSDIQKGFIRAEIISLNDFLAAGGETPAKQAGKQRLEQKEYIMQDGDMVNFRFNK